MLLKNNMENPFKKIAIIGLGLIGGSIGLAVKRFNNEIHLQGFAKSDLTVKTALSRGLVSEAYLDLRQINRDIDLVILATPLSSFASIVKEISPKLKDGCVITDTGSAKSKVIIEIEDILPESINFVPGHPIAGTEMSGPEAGFADLFDNRWCVLTPSKRTNLDKLNNVKAFWENLGAMVEIMDPEYHDKVLAITSHIPHLIAYNIVGTANDLANVNKKEVVKYSAGGFRDFTRIAASDPIMWRDIFINNSDAVLEMLDYFSNDLDKLKSAIKDNNYEYLENFFKKTRNVRKNIIEAGQDTQKVDFGRGD